MASEIGFSCDVCGFEGAKNEVLLCSSKDRGCTIGRHIYCFSTPELAKISDTKFICELCRRANEHSKGIAGSNLRPIQAKQTDSGASKASSLGGTPGLVSKSAPMPKVAGTAARPSQIKVDEPVVKPPETSAHVPQQKSQVFRSLSSTSSVKSGETGLKQQPGGQLPVKKKPPGLANPVTSLLKMTMTGLDKEVEHKQKAKETNDAAMQPRAESESHSEMLLKRAAKKKAGKTGVSWEHQVEVITSSLKGPSVWQGQLQLPGHKEEETVAVAAFGVAGNSRAMDAALRLPKTPLVGESFPAWDLLDMTASDASEGAALVLNATNDADKKILASYVAAHLSPSYILKVPTGVDKPFWLALLPSPDKTALFGALVRYDEEWKHSERQPGNSLLKKEDSGSKRKRIEWPDHDRHTRRSSDCERGPGPTYGETYIPPASQTSPAQPETEVAEAEAKAATVKPASPPPGPLSWLTLCLVGFIRDHEKIQQLRSQLLKLEAKIFTNPWPGCVNTLCFPEQMVEKEPGIERYAPEEMQPLKDFLRFQKTRAFLRIDYPHMCAQLKARPTFKQEQEWKIRELWPEGIHILVNAASFQELTALIPQESSHSVFEKLMKVLNTKARSCKLVGSIWQLSIAAAHLEEAKTKHPQAHHQFQQWSAVKRCKLLDQGLISRDQASTAVKAAHFFRYYCRHTVVVVSSEDDILFESLDATKTVHAVRARELLELISSFEQ